MCSYQRRLSRFAVASLSASILLAMSCSVLTRIIVHSTQKESGRFYGIMAASDTFDF